MDTSSGIADAPSAGAFGIPGARYGARRVASIS